MTGALSPWCLAETATSLCSPRARADDGGRASRAAARRLRPAVDARLLAGLDQRIGWVQTSVESVGAKLGSMEAEVSKMAVAHEGLERRVVGALEQILHRVNEMERKMPRGRAGM